MTAAADALALCHTVSQLVVICDELSVFTPEDAQSGARLAARVRGAGTLDLESARAAWRLLHRYRTHALFPQSPPLPSPGLPSTGPVAAAVAPPDAVTPPAAPAGPSAGTAKLLADGDGFTGRIGIKSAFEHADALRSLPGRVWDRKRRMWTIPATVAAAGIMLEALPTLRCSPRVAEMAAEYARWPEIARYIDPDVPVPDLDFSQWAVSGLVHAPDLWEHQKRGALYASEMSAAVLGVPMGGGKSGIVVAALNRVGARRVLIACPEKVLGVWPKQFRKHSPIEWHVENGKRMLRTGRLASYPVGQRFDRAEQTLFDCACGRPHAVVVNFEALTYDPWKSWRPVADADGDPVDVAVYDEGHRLGSFSGNAKVAGVVAKYARWIRRRWMTTGTPMPQSPLDVFHPFRALDEGIFGGLKTAFATRYAEKGGFEGKQVIGLRDPEGLARRFFQVTYLPTVDLDLPPSVDVTLDVTLEDTARRLYDELERQTWADVAAAVAAMGGRAPDEGEELTVSPPSAGVLLIRLQQLTGGAMRMDNDELAVVSRAKQVAVAEAVAELGCRPGGADGRSAPEPVVIFTRFVHDLDALREEAEKLGVRYGEVSGRRSDLTADATMPEDVDLLGVQIQSGGTGIDLTRAAIAGFYSLGYSLSDYLQARARVLRPGQTRPVRFLHWVAVDSNDAEVYAALEARQDVIAAVLATRGYDAAALGLATETVPGPEWAGETDASALRVALPEDIARFAPGARLGSPAARASGRGSATRAARRQWASVAPGPVTGGQGRRRSEVDELIAEVDQDTLRMFGLEGL